MDLEEFIAETLRQAIKGVTAAQKYARENDAVVAPINISTRGDVPANYIDAGGFGSQTHKREIHVIEFDVAVTVTEGSDKEGRIGVASLFSLGGSKKSVKSSEAISRVKFTVPVVYPHKGKEKSATPRP